MSICEICLYPTHPDELYACANFGDEHCAVCAGACAACQDQLRDDMAAEAVLNERRGK